MTDINILEDLASPVSASDTSSASLSAHFEPLVVYSRPYMDKEQNAITSITSNQLLASQKRSSETALAEIKILADHDSKRSRVIVQSLESEKSDLINQIKYLKRRLEESDSQLVSAKSQIQNIQGDAQARIDSIAEACRQQNNLLEKVDQLDAQSIGVMSRLQDRIAESEALSAELEVTRRGLKISEMKVQKLLQLREEDKVALDEVNSLRLKVNELEAQNMSLTDQVDHISHGPGNASSLVSRPDGSGLCMRSSSILHSTRLEQRIRKLETENSDLRHTESQLAVVRVEVEDLKARLERANEWRDRALLAEEKLSNQCGASQTPSHHHLTDKSALVQSQRESALLLAELGELKSELVATSAKVLSQTEHLQGQTREIEQLQRAVEGLEVRSRRLNRRVKILQQERDMYRQFVESFEDADATLASPAGELVHRFQALVGELSDSLQTFHRQSEADDSELQRLHALIFKEVSNRSSHAATGFMEDALSPTGRQTTILALRQTVAELEDKADKLEMENQNLAHEVECLRARGAFNPDTTQILHLDDNPADVLKRSREKEVVILRKENAQLQQRVNILQDRLSRLYESISRQKNDTDNSVTSITTGDVTMAVQESLKHHPDPLSEIEKLKKKLQSERWRTDRLMETFASASSEFRDACTLLFGYNLQIRQSGAYKVELRDQPGTCGEAGGYLKFKRSNDSVVLTETTFKGAAEDLLRSDLPVPILLARLILLLTGRSSNCIEESTMII